ncbi:hypothetical protein CC79DRAFT_1364010 [Sarocladium strictum]
MVGIGKKPKACLNCRKRRIVCSFERPRCLRCSKEGVQCLGYERRLLFINHTLPNPSPSTKEGILVSKVPDSSPQEDAFQDVADTFYDLSRMLASSSYSTIIFRAKAFQILRRIYLPTGQPDESIAVGSCSWVETVCECPRPNSTLDQSILALCAAQLYITRSGSISLDRALEYYSNGLARLSADLQHIDSTTLASLLASVVVLSTCELFVCPLNAGWHAHVQGIAELLRYRGLLLADLGQYPPAWDRLCSRARIMCVLTGLMNQSSSMVSREQWRTILPPTPSDDPLDGLLDIICELPAFFEESALSRNSTTDIFRILLRVYDWEKAFRRKVGSSPYTYVPSLLWSPVDAGHDERLYPLVLDFPSLQVACCLIICWATMLQSLTVITRLRKEGGTSSESSLFAENVWACLDQKTFKSMSAEGALSVEAKRRAGLLCQCIEYTHGDDMGSLGPQCMTFARGVLRQYYEQEGMTRQLSWCENIPNMTNQQGERMRVQLHTFRA